MNEIVKYQNDFNYQALRRFTAEELNLLMTILHKARNNETKTLNFSFQELKELIKLEKNMTVKEFSDVLININKKLLALNYIFRTEDLIIQFALFQEFVINRKKQDLTIAVSERFKFLLNDFEPGGWTRFELEEFINFKSSYTKEFFRRMKQFRSTGIWRVNIEEFRRLFDIPEKYKIGEIDKWVLKPILVELGEKYKLKIQKIYGKSGGRGRSKITGFEFTFLKEDPKKIEYKDNLKSYIGRKVRMEDKGFGRHNILTIMELFGDDLITGILQNADDGYINELVFSNKEHFMNWFEKYKI